LVYDLSLKRPACAILQAVFGGDQGIAGEFPSEHRLTAPTSGMKVYQISNFELEKVIQYHRKLVVGVTVPEGKSGGL